MSGNQFVSDPRGEGWDHCLQALLKTGAVPLLGRLLETDNVDVLIPVVGTLQECASEVRKEGGVKGSACSP